MYRVFAAGLILLFAHSCFGKDKPTITIRVVTSKASTRDFSYFVPATAGKSTTNCDTTGSVSDGGYINANTDCTTKTTPGTPAHTETNYIQQKHIYVILPNSEHVVLWCQDGWRRCADLVQGSYEAEVKGDSAWLYTHDLSGKVHKIKYHATGTWDDTQLTGGGEMSPAVPAAMKESSLVYLDKELHIWTAADANRVLGKATGYRKGAPESPADIFAYDDPTKQFKSFELSFSKDDRTLKGIYAYPWKLTWSQCKELWGDNVLVRKRDDATEFRIYKDRQLNLVVDKDENVLMVAVY